MNVTAEQFRKEAARRSESRRDAVFGGQKAFAVDRTRAVITKGASYTSAARTFASRR